MRVLVLSCERVGFEVARRVAGLAGVEAVLLATAPLPPVRRSRAATLRHIHASRGVIGLARYVGAGLLRRLRRPKPAAEPPLPPGVLHWHFASFHDSACIEALRRWRPDLGLVQGTYILKESVFTLPVHGCLNLHPGRVPDYRGSASTFWAVFNGETEAGVTVHQVTAELDAGDVFKARTLPLDPAPPGDPLDYIQRYPREVLAPAGIDLLLEVVEEVRDGRAAPQPQPAAGGHTYNRPDAAAIRELRRRVRQRRRARHRV